MMLEDRSMDDRLYRSLREIEARYDVVIGALEAGVVLQQADGSIQTCNASAERILGLTADQMMGRTSIDPRWRALHEDGSPFPGDTHPAMIALRTGQACSNVVMGIHHPDDTLVWISVSSQPLFRPNEAMPYAVVTSFVDITERKRIEDALREREAQYRSLFEQSIDAILLTIPDGHILAANSAACRIFGATEDELRTGGRAMVIDTTDPRLPAALEERARTGRFRGELTFRRKNGATFPGEVSSAVYFDQYGQARTSMSIRDISERHQLEAEVRRAEQHQRALLNAIPDLVWLKDRQGRYIEVNPAYAMFYRQEPRAFVGLNASSFNPEAVTRRYEQDDAEVIASGHSKRFEIQLADQSGQLRWFEVIKSPIESISGDVTGIAGIARDITNRKTLEREREALLLQAKKTLQRTEALYHLADTLNQTQAVPPILQAVAESAAQILPAHRTVLITVDMASQTVKQQLEGGPGAMQVPMLTFTELWAGLSGVVMRNGLPVRSLSGVTDQRESEQVQQRRRLDRAGSILVVPIQSQGTILGTLTAINALDQDDFTSSDMELLATLANQAAIAIERTLLLAELQHQATVDSLTQLLNRRSWLEQSQRIAAMADRTGRPLAVILLDADHFKHINDTYGHDVGDLVLQTISQIVQQTVRRSDIVGRYGGEEFIILLPETNAPTAFQIAERIRTIVANHTVAIKHQQVGMTCSLGLAAAPAGRLDLATLLTQADRALYEAKHAGRNCVRLSAGEQN
jgi:diguanylate cyclase (GGDEF)-like protein/PAS domain S-box-containing protein